MTIQRQYSLPNCKLILEGLSADPSADAASLVRPPLAILTNVECHIVGQDKVLTGGRDFLESLVWAINQYIQEYLSGVRHPDQRDGKPELVQIQKLGDSLHRLSVYSEKQDSQTREQAAPIQMDLRTVQLFDLVEAVDQLCADTQTLPDLALDLKPVSRQFVANQEPVAKRALPAALGISSLAVAAGLLFLVPVPERRPEPAAEQATPELSTSPPASASPPDPPGASPAGETEGAIATPLPVSEAASPAPESPSLEASPDTATPGAESPAASPQVLSASSEIIDPEQLSQLNRQLRDKLAEAWEGDPTFEEDLVFRVSVAANGDIVGSRYVNDAAVQNANQTPLLDLGYRPTESPSQEPTGQFRVVFTPNKVVQVSPWYGRPPSPGQQ